MQCALVREETLLALSFVSISEDTILRKVEKLISFEVYKGS